VRVANELGPGSRLANYLIEEQVGKGGMGVVFRARHELLRRVDALKVLSPDLSADQAFRARFIRESRAAAAVDEPHILPVYDAGEASGVLYIATRFVPGGDLARLLKRNGGSLPPGRAAAFITQVASALDAAHAAGLVHRDVKPLNILVDMPAGRPEHAYLTDFGLTKITTSATGPTSTGSFFGTPDFCPPEQILGRDVDGRTDQYALACTAFQLLAGRAPFARQEPLAVLYAQVNEPPPAVTTVRPDLPPQTDHVLARALAKAPQDRFATCGQFAEALRGALAAPARPAAISVAAPAAAGHSQPPGGVAANQDAANQDAETRATATVPARPPAQAAGHPSPARQLGPGSRPGDRGGRRRGPGRPRSKIAAAAGLAVVIAGAATALSLAPGPGPGRQAGDSGGHGATQSPGGGGAVNAATATSATDFGGMRGLIAAAKGEGRLNVTTLPRDWANYGALMDGFTRKYGIKITDADPNGSSQDEINAIKSGQGRAGAPDVVDVDGAVAVSGAASGLWAPYKVATWDAIPATAKAAGGGYYADYGGYVAIGYDPAKVKVAPTSLRDLLKPAYKHQVAIDGDPTKSSAAFAAVFAAALANGGSLGDIAPGIAYFKQLKQAGNFVPTTGTPATVESGLTPILIWWDYLMVSQVKPVSKGFTIVIPPDGPYAAYYYQAISKYAPHPAAARLWEEYLYSAEGQNGFLKGPARPIELSALTSAGAVDKSAGAALPPAPAGVPPLPSPAQLSTAESVVARQWPTAMG
jgi:putative spermidine/putrescine transport system substrate-binding protein